ncbi:hypothetical protein CPC08DRAFT_686006 [Agrocybe pediades]|nr:hypothetical protein CPC08DRAFT_686006 [Agrocybe pediades]
MADLQVSPISQLLHTLGLTREDLSKRSDEMRQFLDSEHGSTSRVLERETTERSRSASDLRSSLKSAGSSRSLARSHSRTSSASVRDTSPPATPVKAEPLESEIPHRRMDSMEIVLERQRKHRKSRRGRERESAKHLPPPSSPSPSNASHSGRNLDSFMQSRDEIRLPESASSESGQSAPPETNDAPPVTPQKSKYYRDHTNLSTTSQSHKESSVKTETPTPTRPLAYHPPQTLPVQSYYAYQGYMGYSQFMPLPYRGATSFPITPQTQRIQPPTTKVFPSPLPPSSPPPVSSPMSSPTRVNLVSSPGPMGPAPEENEYDNLPYKLPPGPYSPNKPDLSYAALVGRAILSSPEHRLTLQEIYDWITIVYPHYKRGETTWMNSIRHVLSTTVCFRKVPRDRSVGRTLWAIYDEDLECFKDGGFKKQLCKDYVNANDAKDKQNSVKGKSRARKRADDDDTHERKSKKTKKESSLSASVTSESSASSVSYLGPTSHSSQPLFPPTRPTTHHQPYYPASLSQPQGFSAEVIFPPLPAAAAFNRVVLTSNSTSSFTSSASAELVPSTRVDDDTHSETQPSTIPSISSSSSISSIRSCLSVPELTPNRSSSPSSSLPATSEADIDMTSNQPSDSKDDSCSNTDMLTSDSGNDSSLSTDGEDDIFNTALLGPVRSWGQPPTDPGGLQPSIELSTRGESSMKNDTVSANTKNLHSKRSTFPPMPSSPTTDRPRYLTAKSENNVGRPSSPLSSSLVPSTPPRQNRELHEISPIRTPISHKGLHMSPSTSLLHYKSNLDPPPVYGSGVQPLDTAEGPDNDDPMRTPRKHDSLTSAVFGVPITPRKLIFSGNITDSPFRTPVGGMSSSPFRTPGTRSIFDPHDPRHILDEEFSRPYNDSPAGLFGNGRGSLLYDSPGIDSSPSKWW